MTRLSFFASVMVLGFGAVLGCGETTTTPPSQLNLDRPMDMTFTCMGGLRIIPDDRAEQNIPEVGDEVTISAMPTTACDFRSLPHPSSTPTPVPQSQRDLTADGGVPVNAAFWFGFILQSGPGTVAIAQFQTKPSTGFAGADVSVLDADPLTPGKNGISIGEDPVAIVTDKTGCKVMTANAGSCDLSVLDVTSAVDFNPSTPIDVRRLEVTNGNGEPIRARPAAMAAEPAVGEVDTLTGLSVVTNDVIGKKCLGTASGVLYIAYPSCHMVAAVDAANGIMVGGIQFDATGVPTILTDVSNIQCVDECTGAVAPTPGIRPVTIDLEKDPRTRDRRLVIGADNSNQVTIVELSETTTMPESVFQVALENTAAGDLGISQLALSPQIGMGGEIHLINDDTAVGGQFQFVYAIATDDTVRVVDVLGIRRECDTQIDPRYLHNVNSVRDLSCLPIGDPAMPRRAGVRGPGVQLPGGDAFPISVDIVKSLQVDGDTRLEEDPVKLIGYFGIVGASNGGVFIVNVDDDDKRDLYNTTRPLLTPLPVIMAHQIRDGIRNRGDLAQIDINGITETLCDIDGPQELTDSIIGGPRAPIPPLRQTPLGTFALEKTFALPGIRQLRCDGVDSTRAISELAFTAPEAVRDFVFPDLAALFTDETFTLTWEGSLSQDKIDTAVDGPAVRESEILVDGTGMKIIDQSKPFCNAGVEKFDIVQMRGCDPSFGDADCPTGYRCFLHPNSQVQGLGACLLSDEADRLAEACKDFLTSVRRYTIGTTESGKIQLLPRRHTLRTTPVEGCVSNDQCTQLANFALTTASAQHPIDDATEPDTRTWTCQDDPLRAPVATGARCAMRCNQSSDCVVGTVCQGGTAGGSDFAGFCMEGVTAPQSCVNAPQRYELRAGDAFAMVGTRTGFEHATITDANGKCVRDPAASPLLVGRIPLNPPACDPTADPLTGRRPDNTFEPNPCSLAVAHTDIQPLYEPGTCTLTVEGSALVERQAPAIRYRSRALNLTIVDPTYPGDLECILDRAGGLGNIPLVVPNFQLNFRVIAGLGPIVVPVAAALPVRIVRGPTNSIWVVDQGDFLSTSISQPSTRGKVFRIEPHALSTVNILE